MGLDSYLPLKKSGQSVIDQNLPYRFLRGQPLKFCDFSKIFASDSLYFSLNLNLVLISCNFLFFDLETKQYSSEAGRGFIRFYLCLPRPAATQDNVKVF